MTKKLALCTALFLILLLTACNTNTITPTFQPVPVISGTAPAVPSQTILPTTTASLVIPTPTPRTLVVCAGPEPDSLFPLNPLSLSAQAILEAVYDGPIDQRNFSLQPVILQNLPSFSGGEVRRETVQVSPGDLILDGNGNWANLSEGVIYRQGGCEGDDCLVTYTGNEPAMVDQMVVRFTMVPGILWSDGAPLTAHDSVYAYEVAKELYPGYRPELIVYTQSYSAVDDTTTEWRGIPGYSSSLFSSFFFPPLPAHAWRSLPPDELPTADLSARNPTGWGPYVIESWVAGDHISLRKNPAYFRASEGLPKFDYLVYRFTDTAQDAIDALLAGECDLAVESAFIESQLDELQALQDAGSLQLFTQPGMAWEQILFGIQPVNTARLPILASPNVRQAIGLCIDRQAIVDELTNGLSTVPNSYILDSHPLYNPEVSQYSFDPTAAGELLTSAGWMDADGNPSTPRLSAGLAGLVDGTLFQITYLALAGTEQERTAQMVKDSLARCGIQLEIQFQDWSQMLAAGPTGPVFGRDFDLAQIAWYISAEPPCPVYTTAEIPGPYPDFTKGWGGANAAGYSNPEFDQVCREAYAADPESTTYTELHHQAQAIFSADLPALPLYPHLKIVAAHPDVCGLSMDPSSPSSLWNIENLDYGESCP